LAAVLSLLVATTIARPLQRLAAEAHALLDRRGRLRGKFQGSSKADEIGELARALEKLTARLRANQDALEAFAADVSHELKNPLAAIRSAAELLAVVEEPEDRARFATLVEREIARCERLLVAVREIGALDVAADVVAAEVDLGAVASDVVAGWRRRAADGVTIEISTVPGPLPVRCEPERLVQVIENLLDNALSFTSPGTMIEVSVQRDGDAAALSVADRGPGIPPEHLERVFDRFFSYRPGAARGAGGHIGLGLALVKAIVEGRGGGVAAANRPDGGARVELRLPAPER
jgi:two-component system sensor histidine kinase ChvG